MTVNVYDLALDDLTSLFTSWGEPAYRALQLWEGLYKNLWSKPDEFTNLPKALRHQLEEYFAGPGEDSQPSFTQLFQLDRLVSSDGETIKTLFRLHDQQTIEAVIMRYAKRRTLCISTQAGCAMGCVFCATGQMGFRRHLSSGEIVEQVLYYARQLAADGEQVTNIVLMGMGEPFHNYDATLAAIQRLNHPQGINLGERRFTISTVGLIPQIRRFTSEHSQINLAISLHAADDELRSSLLPINKKYPLEDLLSTCRDYVETTHRRLTFEWALIRDINDNLDQARKLAKLLKGMLCHVNIIPLNPTYKYSGQATTRQRALAFQAELDGHGIPCTIRLRRGLDIQAGCGQLAAQNILR